MPDPIQPPPINPSPKARFIATKGAIGAHRDLIVRTEFQFALDHALLEYVSTVAAKTEPNLAISGHFKSVGAIEFVAMLKTLAEAATQIKFQKPVELDHTV